MRLIHETRDHPGGRRAEVLRGFILGTIWGLILAGGVAAVSSLSLPLPGDMPPATGAAEVPAGSGFMSNRADSPAELPRTEASPEIADVPRSETPEADDLAAIRDDALEPATPPAIGGPETELSDPPGTGSTKGAEPTAEQPVLPNPQAALPGVPGQEPQPDAATEPRTPPRAEPGETITQFSSSDLEMAATTPDAPEAQADLPTPPEDPAEAEAGAGGGDAVAADPAEAVAEPSDEPADPAGEAATDAEGADVTVAEASEPDATDAPSAEATEESAADPTDTPVADTAEEPDAPVAQAPDPEATEEPAEADAEATTAGTGLAGRPATTMPGQRAVPLTERNAAPAEDTATEAAPEADPVDPDAPAIDRFAAPFDNPEAKPLLSIVLIDDGIDDGQAEDGFALPRNFPYPLSVAIPVDAPDAAEKQAMYRAAGHEVLALVDLPEGVTAQDMETQAAGWFQALDEAVAVMETPDRSLQAGRAQSEQLAEILTDSGHGLLLYPERLDTARKLAAREGVPAATVFRDLDGEGQSGTVMRRFMDNAAFRAGQEEAVILVARLRPDTVSVLLLWGLADRASRVAMAPVSYAIKASTDE